MFGSRFISLTTKLASLIALLLMIVISVSNYFQIRRLAEFLETGLDEKAAALTSTVASNCANALAGGDMTFLDRSIKETLRDHADTAYGVIAKEDGSIVVYHDKGKTDAQLEEIRRAGLTDKFSKEAVEKGKVASPLYRNAYHDPERDVDVLDMAGPVIVGDQRWVVRLVFSKVEVQKAKRAAWQTSALVTAAFVLVGVLVALFVSRRITRPISLLVQDAAAIAQGNLEKEITVATTDEIGILAHAFEKMRTSLKFQFKEIAKKAMGLEGDLDVFALPDLLQLVCSSGRTGQLIMDGPADRGSIFFNAGEIIHAELQGEGGEFRGPDAVYRFFNWTDGSFKFDSIDISAIPKTISVGWQHLIMEGARQTDEMDRIKQVIPSEDCVVCVEENPPEGTDEIRLTVEELQVSILVQGRKRVGDVLQQSSFDEFDTYQMLYRLVSAGLLRIEGR
ncbi:MAG: DUF4388 domain-containing protein [Candidatus Schekmanbacteria bacterium]|nr:DUF4388 domain-containing protein [Candidatus Schekmanbacteria bacterium]